MSVCETQEETRTNCKNCGAPLPSAKERVVLYYDDMVYGERGNKCEYCGTPMSTEDKHDC